MILKANHAAATTLHVLVLTTIKIFCLQIQYRRLSSSGAKEKFLGAIKSASDSIPLSECLLAMGLTAARYHILRLQEGSRPFVQCMIDSYSMYVLAWKVSKDYGGVRTKELRKTALAKAKSLGLEVKPKVLVDRGCENINPEANDLVVSEPISRTITQIDIEESSFVIEMLLHRLKHRYWFTILRSDFESWVKGTDFCLYGSNTSIPFCPSKGLLRKKL